MGHPTIPTVPSILLVVVPILVPILRVIPVLVLVRILLVHLSRPGNVVLLGGPSRAIHYTMPSHACAHASWQQLQINRFHGKAILCAKRKVADRQTRNVRQDRPQPAPPQRGVDALTNSSNTGIGNRSTYLW